MDGAGFFMGRMYIAHKQDAYDGDEICPICISRMLMIQTRDDLDTSKENPITAHYNFVAVRVPSV